MPRCSVAPIFILLINAAMGFTMPPDSTHENIHRKRGKHRELRRQPHGGIDQGPIGGEPDPDSDGQICHGTLEIRGGRVFFWAKTPSYRLSAVIVRDAIRPSWRTGIDGHGILRRTERGWHAENISCDEAGEADFTQLTSIRPREQLKLETRAERFDTRTIDIIAPIGKGQRGLIVAGPRTGKTTILRHIGEAISQNYPDIDLMILLVDERPEEVTDLQRKVPQANLMASTFDSDLNMHARVTELAVERAKRKVEQGRDVVILVDSLTRIGRTYNNLTAGRGRTMSGGIDSRALEAPRRFFATARNLEEGGSLTILATALTETGSRMDDLIFQEFKGTGNMELVLDRSAADHRIWPAVNIALSGTRHEEILLGESVTRKVTAIRRGTAGMRADEASGRLASLMSKFPTNAALLEHLPD